MQIFDIHSETDSSQLCLPHEIKKINKKTKAETNEHKKSKNI